MPTRSELGIQSEIQVASSFEGVTTTRQLMCRTGLSGTTVRRVLLLLQDDGLVTMLVRGKYKLEDI